MLSGSLVFLSPFDCDWSLSAGPLWTFFKICGYLAISTCTSLSGFLLSRVLEVHACIVVSLLVQFSKINCQSLINWFGSEKTIVICKHPLIVFFFLVGGTRLEIFILNYA